MYRFQMAFLNVIHEDLLNRPFAQGIERTFSSGLIKVLIRCTLEGGLDSVSKQHAVPLSNASVS